ncbi:MAG: hypothetical protein RSF70_06795, partial [Ruthenibacterium sp.]
MKMKKILSLVLTLTLVTQMCLPIYAEMVSASGAEGISGQVEYASSPELANGKGNPILTESPA